MRGASSSAHAGRATPRLIHRLHRHADRAGGREHARVFGDDIQRAVEDGATVPLYYESRLAKLALDEAEWPKIDPDFEEVTEGEEVDRKELKTKWAQIEAVVGAEKRLKLVARDIVQHFERRLEATDGKAMVCARAGASPWSCTAS
jgi:type I site-specific restriction-modification system R (restriction) subunit